MADRASCPSAQPEQNAGAVIGVVGRRGGAPLVSMLSEPVPLESVAHLIPDAVPAAEVLRLAGPCAEQACRHFADGRCTLAARIVAILPEVVERLPRCGLRPSCRWWRQEGRAACLRCPQIVTEPFAADAVMRELAIPLASSIEGGTENV